MPLLSSRERRSLQESGEMEPDLTRRWYTVGEVAQMLEFGISKTKQLVAQGEIRSIRVGGSRRILPAWVDDYVAAAVERNAS